VAFGARGASGSEYWMGIGYGLLTGIFYANFLICLRQARTLLRDLTTAQVLVMISLLSTLFLFLFSLAEGSRLLLTSGEVFWLAILAVVPHVFGWLLIASSLPYVPIAVGGLILLVQPVLATILGAILFGETFLWLQMIGAFVTLVSIYIGSTRRV